jgi:hypothetical protein
MQQTDACGYGVHHSLTHSIATQAKSGWLHLIPPLHRLISASTSTRVIKHSRITTE